MVIKTTGITWKDIKALGSKHYKASGGVEMIDVYKADGTLQDWAINEARHHLARNISMLDTLKTDKCVEDMKKVMHYAMIVICLAEEAQRRR